MSLQSLEAGTENAPPHPFLLEFGAADKDWTADLSDRE